MQKTILVCDDHDLFLGGMAEILNKFGENYKIITFNNSVSCIKYIQQNKVEVFICDLNIDHTDGFALIGNLKKELTQTKIIILTAYFEDFLIQKSEEFAQNIDARLLASYQRIRTNSPTGLAVVGLERGAPKGSFFTLPPQKQMEIAQRKKIIIDEHSGKILVDDDMVNEENEKMKEIIKF